MWATELRSVDHQLAIRQIGKPGALRTLEVFAAEPSPVEADQVLHAAVGVESDRDPAAPEQEAADGAGASDIVGHIGAIDQPHRQQGDPAYAHRLQDEGVAAPSSARHTRRGQPKAACRASSATSASDKPSTACAPCWTTSTRMPFAKRDSAGKEKNEPPQ